MKIVAVIPARYASTRFPGKPLASILGKPMIQWVYERAAGVKGLSDVFVATDDSRISECVRAFGGKTVMTSASLRTGSDRVAEAIAGIHCDWVLNIQGDEPLISTSLIAALIRRALGLRIPGIVTPVAPILRRREYLDPNVVKAVFDGRGRALYFSRAPIPDISRVKRRPIPKLWKHLGVYLFHRKTLLQFSKTRPTFLEKTECLEQLRALESGVPVHVVKTRYSPVSVDVPLDIRRVEMQMKNLRHA